jgi:deoxyadenosine/deoxycytidine kinase
MAEIIYCGNMVELVNLTNIIKDDIFNNAYSVALYDVLSLIFIMFITCGAYVIYLYEYDYVYNKINTKPRPIIISIEGNIGTGKSTFIEKVQEYFTHINKDIHIGFIPEPVNVWNSVTDDNGVTILEKYYENQHKYAFPFQMMAYISRLAVMRESLNKGYDVIIMERSMFTDCKVFAKMLYDDKKIEPIEYNIYKKWFDEFVDDFPEIFHIYIQADPAVSSGRVIKRGRQGETIPLSYLEKCHEYHEKWLLEGEEDIPVLIFDGNTEMDENGYNNWIELLEEFIRGKIVHDTKYFN